MPQFDLEQGLSDSLIPQVAQNDDDGEGTTAEHTNANNLAKSSRCFNKLILFLPVVVVITGLTGLVSYLAAEDKDDRISNSITNSSVKSTRSYNSP